jgi:hypothetical protein
MDDSGASAGRDLARPPPMPAAPRVYSNARSTWPSAALKIAWSISETMRWQSCRGLASMELVPHGAARRGTGLLWSPVPPRTSAPLVWDAGPRQTIGLVSRAEGRVRQAPGGNLRMGSSWCSGGRPWWARGRRRRGPWRRPARCPFHGRTLSSRAGEEQSGADVVRERDGAEELWRAALAAGA